MSGEHNKGTSARAAEVAELLRSSTGIGPSPDTSSHEIQCRIEEVPNSTRIDLDSKYYKPLVVSIGPIHHGKTHLKAMEKYKQRVALKWAEHSQTSFLDSIERLYTYVELYLLEARKCYPESYSTTCSERDWCKMMFLDACFTIEFMVSEVEPSVPGLPGSTDPFMKNHDRDLVRRDLLLLENQLPNKVVDIFAYLRLGRTKKHLIPEWLVCNFIGRNYYREIPDTDHLLDYLRTLWIGPKELENEIVEELENEIVDEGGEEKYHLVNSLSSVTELKKAGIYCSRIKGRPNFLSSARFKSYVLSGELTLPQLKIHEWTKHVFLNLVAYEISGNKHETGISSYLNFMGILINQAEDVKELRSEEILVLDNFNGDDQAVVDLFREMKAHVVPNPRSFMRVRQKIYAYGKKSKRQPLRALLAEFKHRYFSTSWSFLVFFAVIFTVGMTIIQTILTAIQTYLAAHPPKK